MYLASYCKVLMTNEMQNSYTRFYSSAFFLICKFRRNQVVYRLENSIIYLITQFGTIVQANLAASK
jgi:archaellum biogenesis protein FlaJ (TadC family)